MTRTWHIYQQLPPVSGEAHFLYIDTVQAGSGADAIEQARKLPCFRRAQHLARYPVVSEQGPV